MCDRIESMKILILLISVLFISCSETKDSKIVIENNSTIRNIISEKDESLIWTNKLEEEVLSQDITRNSAADDSAYIVVDTLKTLDSKTKVYPELSGFSKLDVSMLESDELSYIKEFCGFVIDKDYEKAVSFFSSDNFHSLVLLKYDLEEYGNLSFTSFLLGEGFWNNENCVIPVRLLSEKKHLDIEIVYNKNSKKLEQVYLLGGGE